MKVITFYIQPDKEDRKGYVPLIAQVTIKSKKYRASIGKLKKRYWSKSKQRVKKNREHEPYNNYKELNTLIENLSKNLFRFNRFDNYTEPPKNEEVKKIILSTPENKQHVTTINDAYQEYIEANINKVAYNTTRNRKTAKKFIEVYQDWAGITLQFEDITRELFNELYNYAFDELELENNTFAAYISKFKSFLEWATEKGYYSGTAHRKFTFTEKEKEAIVLTMAEFKQLFNFDFSNNKKLEKARDLYCFGCLTALRYSDIKSLRYEHLTNDFIKKRIVKTKETLSIPILSQTKKLIDKYKNDSIYVLPQLSNVKLNAYIKECCKIAGINTPTLKQSYKGNKITETTHPKHELITAHTSRKTFITIAYLNGVDIPTIMAITGHKSYKMLKRYLKENVDKMKRDLENAWKF